MGPGRAQTRLGSPSCWSLTPAAPEASPPRPSSRALAQQASPGSSVLPGAWALLTQQVRSVQVAQEGCGDAVGSGRGLRGPRTVRGLTVAFWAKDLSSEPRPERQLRSPGADTDTQNAPMRTERPTHGHRQTHGLADRTTRRPLRHMCRGHTQVNTQGPSAQKETLTPLRLPPTLDRLSVSLGYLPGTGRAWLGAESGPLPALGGLVAQGQMPHTMPPSLSHRTPRVKPGAEREVWTEVQKGC